MTNLKKLAEEIHKKALPHSMAEGGIFNPKTPDHRYAIHIECLTCEQKEPIIQFIESILQKVRNETIEEISRLYLGGLYRGIPFNEEILKLKSKESDDETQS